MVGIIYYDLGEKMLQKIKNLFKPKKRANNKKQESLTDLSTITIVGSPNVGKSVLFHALTKKYVTASNYPGTTVKVTRGIALIENKEYEVVDTPGIYSFFPITEEERIARRILLTEKPDCILHVIDAKNIGRMLSFTLQLIEAELPVILVLNIMDEAKKEGVHINTELLKEKLGISVVETVSTKGVGVNKLKKRIVEHERKI